MRFPPHGECADLLAEQMAAMGVEVTVSTEPPTARSPYTADPFTCPHGVSYWIEPTAAQLTRWAAEDLP
ncbi:hypothetical protein [Actinomadura nitritigenes]|uniref:hypothetical protein n=1 Tax=Actinomadura nitritigenes TaxID=134602 RepID=UPI003D8D1DEE